MNGRKELLRTATAMAMEMTKEDEKRSGSQHKRIGEVAGGTAAECAMVCCCCPCTVLHFLILALYKVPAGLCRKAWRNKKKRKKLLTKQKNIDDSLGVYYTDDEKEFDAGNGDDDDHDRGSPETAEFESEMWNRFYGGTGFGRSSSQREEQQLQQQHQ